MRRLQDGRTVLRIPEGWDQWTFAGRIYRIDSDGIVRYTVGDGLWRESHLRVTT
jgi:hypothetical protein